MSLPKAVANLEGVAGPAPATPLQGVGDQDVPNFSSLIAEKSVTSPPTRLEA